MIDYTRTFHTGLLTPDLDAAIDHYTRTLGLRFAAPVLLEALPLWTPQAGLHTVSNRFTYSLDGPLHLELQGGTPGSYYDPALSRGDHLGVWVPDVAAAMAGLLADGWEAVAAGGAPEDGWGLFAYAQPVGGGMVVEVVSEALEPAFTRWWAGGPLEVG